jgi:hypothetical protein
VVVEETTVGSGGGVGSYRCGSDGGGGHYRSGSGGGLGK